MKKKKYKIPVTIQAIACKTLGVIECDSLDEYMEMAERLWEESGFEDIRENISNDFEISSDSEISEIKEDDLKYYLNENNPKTK